MKLTKREIDGLVLEYELVRDTNMGTREMVGYLFMLGYWRGRERNTIPLIGIALFVGLVGGFLLAGNL